MEGRILRRRTAVLPLALMVGGAWGCEDDKGNTLPGSTSGGNNGAPEITGIGANTSEGTGGSSTGGASSGTGGGSMTVDPSTPAACQSIVGIDNSLDCGSQAGTATIRRPNMLIVLDKSGSQGSQGFEGQTNWEALTAALEAALMDVEDVMSFGLKLYPNKEVRGGSDCIGFDCCAVSNIVPNSEEFVRVRDGRDALPEILDLMNSTTPSGGTPTSGALRAALEYYTEGDGMNIVGEKYVLLATDGGPNCNSDLSCEAEGCTINLEGRCSQPGFNCCEPELQRPACLDDTAVVEAITELRDAGIDTYVVGIPGSESYASFLDDFAEAGGRVNPDGPEKYYAVDGDGGVEGLTNVFKNITTALIQTCDFQLETTPPDPEKVNVALDCTAVSRGDDDAAGDAGGDTGAWTLDDTTDPPTVRLLGETCEEVQATGVERIDFIFGCPTIR